MTRIYTYNTVSFIRVKYIYCHSLAVKPWDTLYIYYIYFSLFMYTVYMQPGSRRRALEENTSRGISASFRLSSFQAAPSPFEHGKRTTWIYFDNRDTPWNLQWRVRSLGKKGLNRHEREGWQGYARWTESGNAAFSSQENKNFRRCCAPLFFQISIKRLWSVFL